MTPNEFYALPSLRSMPWHAAGRSAAGFLDIRALSVVQAILPSPEGAEALTFETKLELDVSPDATVAYVAVTWRGRGIGMLVHAGHLDERIVTDVDGFAEALAFVEAQLPHEWVVRRDAEKPDRHLHVLDGTFGCALIEKGGRMALVEEEHLDGRRRLLFDREAFDRAFGHALDPDARAAMRQSGAWRAGIRMPWMRSLACRAIRDAVPEGIARKLANRVLPPGKFPMRKVDWAAVVVASGEGTYAIGLGRESPTSGTSWVGCLRTMRLGDPGVFGEIAETDGALEGEWFPAHA